MNDLHVNLWDLLSPLSKTMDMMSPTVGEHSLTVAYLSLRLCEILNQIGRASCRVTLYISGVAG